MTRKMREKPGEWSAEHEDTRSLKVCTSRNGKKEGPEVKFTLCTIVLGSALNTQLF